MLITIDIILVNIISSFISGKNNNNKSKPFIKPLDISTDVTNSPFYTLLQNNIQPTNNNQIYNTDNQPLYKNTQKEVNKNNHKQSNQFNNIDNKEPMNKSSAREAGKQLQAANKEMNSKESTTNNKIQVNNNDKTETNKNSEKVITEDNKNISPNQTNKQNINLSKNASSASSLITKLMTKKTGRDGVEGKLNNTEIENIVNNFLKTNKNSKVKTAAENLTKQTMNTQHEDQKSARQINNKHIEVLEKLAKPIIDKSGNIENNIGKVKDKLKQLDLKSKNGKAKYVSRETIAQSVAQNNNKIEKNSHEVNNLKIISNEKLFSKDTIQKSNESESSNQNYNGQNSESNHLTSNRLNYLSKFENDPIAKSNVRRQIDAIFSRARMIVKNSGNATLSTNLYPKELGKISMQLMLLDGKLHGTFIVDNETIQKELNQRIDKIITDLKNDGYEIEEFNVNVKSQNQEQQSKGQKNLMSNKKQSNISYQESFHQSNQQAEREGIYA